MQSHKKMPCLKQEFSQELKKGLKKSSPSSTVHVSLDVRLRDIMNVLRGVAENISCLKERVNSTDKCSKENWSAEEAELQKMRALMCLLDENIEQNEEVTKRGVECIDMWESMNKGRVCGADSASCMQLKQELLKVTEEKIQVENKIRVMMKAEIRGQRRKEKWSPNFPLVDKCEFDLRWCNTF